MSGRMASSERLFAVGPTILSDQELLVLLLDAVSAARLLEQFSSLEAIAAASNDELLTRGRLRVDAVAQLRAGLELGRRSLALPLERGSPISSAKDVEERLRPHLVHLDQEELHVLGLDTHNRLLVHYVAGKGSLNQVYATARDVFRPLVREGAHAAIVVHNHPSGACDPSAADVNLTNRLVQAGELVGIPLLDHIVLSRKGRFSFAEKGKMPFATAMAA